MSAPAGMTFLVQSTDSFSDCWVPFFTLLRHYWPDCPLPILLNTETKAFSFPGLNVRSTRILARARTGWPTWSESLLLCLDHVETDLVLFMIEDFFISGPVDTVALEAVAERMRSRRYTNVTLTDHGIHRKTAPTEDPWLLSVLPRTGYRVTTAPALWSKDGLKRYLRASENAWQFEIFGTRRSWRTSDTFFVANPARLTNGREGIIPYFKAAYDSGIVKGKWQEAIAPFFRQRGIEVDYTARGFFKPLPRVVNKYRLLTKLLENPFRVIQGMRGR